MSGTRNYSRMQSGSVFSGRRMPERGESIAQNSASATRANVGAGLVPARTFSLDIASPINALSKNKDGSMIVVAGRTGLAFALASFSRDIPRPVFKTLKLCEDKFEELLNLRVGRMNLTFSSTDVQWHPLDGQYYNFYLFIYLFIYFVRMQFSCFLSWHEMYFNQTLL